MFHFLDGATATEGPAGGPGSLYTFVRNPVRAVWQAIGRPPPIPPQ
jgi:hypothetical protein